MSKQSDIREGIAKRKLEIVTRCEVRLIHTLSPKVQKQIDHEPYTWETIPEHLKAFWLEEADNEMKDLDSQGVVIKVDREFPQLDALVIDWVCPNNHNPTTPYEKGEVKRLMRFAEDVLIYSGVAVESLV